MQAVVDRVHRRSHCGIVVSITRLVGVDHSQTHHPCELLDGLYDCDLWIVTPGGEGGPEPLPQGLSRASRIPGRASRGIGPQGRTPRPRTQLSSVLAGERNFVAHPVQSHVERLNTPLFAQA